MTLTELRERTDQEELDIYGGYAGGSGIHLHLDAISGTGPDVASAPEIHLHIDPEPHTRLGESAEFPEKCEDIYGGYAGESGIHLHLDAISRTAPEIHLHIDPEPPKTPGEDPDASSGAGGQDDGGGVFPGLGKGPDRPWGGMPQLNGGLRFESGRLYLGGRDAAGRPVYWASGCHAAPTGDLDVSRLQPFYEVALEEAAHMDGPPGAGHVYSVGLARLLDMMETREGELSLGKDEAIDYAVSAIDYGNGFVAPVSAPWKNCLRLLGHAGYDWEKDIVLFTAPLLSRLIAAGPKSGTKPAGVPAGDIRIIEAEAENAKGITRTKLLRLGLLDQFQFIQESSEGGILFAVPLPPPYGDGLEYELSEDGGIRMTEEGFYRLQDAWQRYAGSLPVCGKRTKGGAGETTPIPDAIAIITDRKYRHALAPIHDSTAFIMPVSVADSLRIGNGMFGEGSFTFSLEDCDPEDVAKLDFTLLATVYSIILKKITDKVNEAGNPKMILRILEDTDFEYTVQLHIPEFLEKIGSKPDADKNRFNIAKEKLQSFNKVVGIHVTGEGRSMQYERYDVMRWVSDSNETNTVRFYSPYCNHIIRILIKKHLKRDKYGNIQMTPGGQPDISPFNSFAIQRILNAERNKPAAEIVRYVAYLVDLAGRSSGTPRAKARTVINECPELKQRIATAKSNSDRNKYLKRAFTRAWQILKEPKCSELLQKRQDFQVPTDIPTMKTLDSLVFRFSSRDMDPRALKSTDKITGPVPKLPRSVLKLPRTVS